MSMAFPDYRSNGYSVGPPSRSSSLANDTNSAFTGPTYTLSPQIPTYVAPAMSNPTSYSFEQDGYSASPQGGLTHARSLVAPRPHRMDMEGNISDNLSAGLHHSSSMSSRHSPIPEAHASRMISAPAPPLAHRTPSVGSSSAPRYSSHQSVPLSRVSGHAHRQDGLTPPPFPVPSPASAIWRPAQQDIVGEMARLNVSSGVLQSSAPVGPRPLVRSSSLSSPSLIAPLPTVGGLTKALPSIQAVGQSAESQIGWCTDVFFLVDRQRTDKPAPPPAWDPAFADLASGSAAIEDPQLRQLADVAVGLVLELSEGPSAVSSAEARFHRACLETSGAIPHLIARNKKQAFRNFELAAEGGYAHAWFRIGRDYESVNDQIRAVDCYERGAQAGDEACIYRIAMCHMFGQLGVPAYPISAIPHLARAATLCSMRVPHAAYVLALLLLDENENGNLPNIPSGELGAQLGEPVREIARRHLERAAYFHYALAQLKIGQCYEHAIAPFSHDPVLSVVYYTFASEQGVPEADVALSKWYLCGSGVAGGFEKDERLAVVFADKAARKGIPSGEFAMGYYAEVGIGMPKDIARAREWYQRASAKGYQQARDRLAALTQPAPQVLSGREHETQLTRQRTSAKQRSQAMAMPTVPPYAHAPALEASVPPPTTARPPDQVSRPHRAQAAPHNGRLQHAQGPPPNARPVHAQSPPPLHMQQQAPRPVVRPANQAPVPLQPAPTNQEPAKVPKKGPTTFEEMGFQGAKAEKNECVVM